MKKKAKIIPLASAEEFNAVVGARVQERRKAKKLLQRELSDAIGRSIAQVSRYESGEAQCEPFTLARIAKALGCKTSDFLDGIEVR